MAAARLDEFVFAVGRWKVVDVPAREQPATAYNRAEREHGVARDGSLLPAPSRLLRGAPGAELASAIAAGGIGPRYRPDSGAFAEALARAPMAPAFCASPVASHAPAGAAARTGATGASGRWHGATHAPGPSACPRYAADGPAVGAQPEADEENPGTVEAAHLVDTALADAARARGSDGWRDVPANARAAAERASLVDALARRLSGLQAQIGALHAQVEYLLARGGADVARAKAWAASGGRAGARAPAAADGGGGTSRRLAVDGADGADGGGGGSARVWREVGADRETLLDLELTALRRELSAAKAQLAVGGARGALGGQNAGCAQMGVASSARAHAACAAMARPTTAGGQRRAALQPPLGGSDPLGCGLSRDPSLSCAPHATQLRCAASACGNAERERLAGSHAHAARPVSQGRAHSGGGGGGVSLSRPLTAPRAVPSATAAGGGSGSGVGAHSAGAYGGRSNGAALQPAAREWRAAHDLEIARAAREEGRRLHRAAAALACVRALTTATSLEELGQAVRDTLPAAAGLSAAALFVAVGERPDGSEGIVADKDPSAHAHAAAGGGASGQGQRPAPRPRDGRPGVPLRATGAAAGGGTEGGGFVGGSPEDAAETGVARALRALPTPAEILAAPPSGGLTAALSAAAMGELRLGLGHGFTGQAFAQRTALLIHRPAHHDRFHFALDSRATHGVTPLALLCCPLVLPPLPARARDDDDDDDDARPRGRASDGRTGADSQRCVGVLQLALLPPRPPPAALTATAAAAADAALAPPVGATPADAVATVEALAPVVALMACALAGVRLRADAPAPAAPAPGVHAMREAMNLDDRLRADADAAGAYGPRRPTDPVSVAAGAGGMDEAGEPTRGQRAPGGCGQLADSMAGEALQRVKAHPFRRTSNLSELALERPANGDDARPVGGALLRPLLADLDDGDGGGGSDRARAPYACVGVTTSFGATSRRLRRESMGHVALRTAHAASASVRRHSLAPHARPSASAGAHADSPHRSDGGASTHSESSPRLSAVARVLPFDAARAAATQAEASAAAQLGALERSVMSTVSALISAHRTRPLQLLGHAARSIGSELGADRCQVWLLHAPTKQLVLYEDGHFALGPPTRQPRSISLTDREGALRSLVGTVALKARPEVVADAYVDGRVDARADAEELYHTNAIAAIPLMLYELKAHAHSARALVAEGEAAHEAGYEQGRSGGGPLLPSRLLAAAVISFVNCLEPPFAFAPAAVRIAARACALLEPTVEFAFAELSAAAGAMLSHASLPPPPVEGERGGSDEEDEGDFEFAHGEGSADSD